jgi:hypothetical protein
MLRNTLESQINDITQFFSVRLLAMQKARLTSRINVVLEKHQFFRKGSLWNRNHSEFVDVVDLQISESKNAFTINVGVANKFVLGACWGVDGNGLVDEPFCTVRRRLGQLLHGRDVWWELSNNEILEDVLSGIEDVALPFLQRHHSIEHLIEAIENDPASKRNPPGVIYLALLHYQKGEGARCMEIFKSMKLNGPWGQKASDIFDALS